MCVRGFELREEGVRIYGKCGRPVKAVEGDGRAEQRVCISSPRVSPRRTDRRIGRRWFSNKRYLELSTEVLCYIQR